MHPPSFSQFRSSNLANFILSLSFKQKIKNKKQRETKK